MKCNVLPAVPELNVNSALSFHSKLASKRKKLALISKYKRMFLSGHWPRSKYLSVQSLADKIECVRTQIKLIKIQYEMIQ